jgi:hypothetical protein
MKFKCKSTNLVYNFEFEVDIMSMMKHPDYECVEEAPAEEPATETKPAAKTTKKSKVTPDESSING